VRRRALTPVNVRHELTDIVEIKAARDQAIGIEAWARQAKDGNLESMAVGLTVGWFLFGLDRSRARHDEALGSSEPPDDRKG
jgi:hypothetical protein